MGVREAHQRLGELLIGKGLLRPAQLQEALEIQRSTQEFLGVLLVRRGWLTEEALLETLAEQFGISRIHLDREPIDWEVASRFPFRLLSEHDCFPIRMDGEEVALALANPLDAWAISEVERVAGFRRVRLLLCPLREIRAALDGFCQKLVTAFVARLKERFHGDL